MTTAAATTVVKRGCLCILYVSEAMRTSTLEQLQSVAGSKLLHSFRDVTYNRTSFYLAGPDMVETAVDMCTLAFALIDFKEHEGTHPALGAVDNICFSPLGEEPMSDAQHCANRFSQLLFDREQVPIYKYGAASIATSSAITDAAAPLQQSLKDIRRKLGYFSGGKQALLTAAARLQHSSRGEVDVNVNNGGRGATTTSAVNEIDAVDEIDSNNNGVSAEMLLGFPAADFGSIQEHFSERKGISCVGAVPLILNFNIRFRPEDPRSRVIQVTKHIRATAAAATSMIGVAPDVEALTLQHQHGSYEVACNLRNPKFGNGPEEVLAAAREKSRELGIEIEESYLTGPSENELLAALNNKLMRR